MSSGVLPTRRALLIGIDNYLANNEDSSARRKCSNLQGCVNDVQLMRGYLITIGVPEANIKTLTAPLSTGIGGSPILTEVKKSQTLPTYKNIIAELDNLGTACKAGDLVYIHYSGHGVRRGGLKYNLPQGGGDSEMGTALVPHDAMVEGKFLTGYSLGLRIRDMVQAKGARVCLVLDCCHSGRGIRSGDEEDIDPPTFTRRYAEVDVDEFEDFMKESDEVASSLLDGDDDVGSRGAVATADWFADPKGCTVMTACRSMETAGEEIVEGTGAKQGVLTRWMLDLLGKRTSGRLPTYERIGEHVNRASRSTKGTKRQHPFVRGDGNIEFFGDTPAFERPACRVLETTDSSVTLDVGSVQGVAEGAIYRILAADKEDYTAAIGLPSIKITQVLPFQSKGTLLDGSETRLSSIAPPGTRAVLRTWALPNPTFVRFITQDFEARKAFHKEIEKTPNLLLVDKPEEEEHAEFEVAVNAEGNFQILEEESLLHRLPVISVKDYHAIKKIAYVVRHVARYRAIEATLQIPRTRHLNDRNFVVTVRRRKAGTDEDDEEYEDVVPDELGRYRLKENEPIEYTFGYTGSMEPVWMSLFEANESWGIEKLYPREGQRAEEMCNPAIFDPDRLLISMEIRPKCTKADPDDTVVNFMLLVATGEDPPSWDEMRLPPLPVDASLLPIDDDEMELDLDIDTPRASKLEVARASEKRFWYSKNFEVHTFPNA